MKEQNDLKQPWTQLKMQVTVELFVYKYHLGLGANYYRMQYETLSCDYYVTALIQRADIQTQSPQYVECFEAMRSFDTT